jgi:hypothetical protein
MWPLDLTFRSGGSMNVLAATGVSTMKRDEIPALANSSCARLALRRLACDVACGWTRDKLSFVVRAVRIGRMQMDSRKPIAAAETTGNLKRNKNGQVSLRLSASDVGSVTPRRESRTLQSLVDQLERRVLR